MTMQASAYGRLGEDPPEISTSTGKAMTVTSIAVNAAHGEGGDTPSLWLDLVAFGQVAKDLARHSKGDLLSVSGRVQVNRWAGKDSAEREQELTYAHHDAVASLEENAQDRLAGLGDRARGDSAGAARCHPRGEGPERRGK